MLVSTILTSTTKYEAKTREGQYSGKNRCRIFSENEKCTGLIRNEIVVQNINK
jgi:hypothetical protein